MSKTMNRLQAAGARVPAPLGGPSFEAQIPVLAASVRRADAALRVADVRATIDWYTSIGFELTGQHELDTDAAWAALSLGGCLLDAFYGEREFTIIDLNGYRLTFAQTPKR